MYQFTETQRFRQWWVWLLMVVSVLPIPTIWFAKSMNGEEIPLWELLFVSAILVAILVLFGTMKLRTRVDVTGIHYKFFPFHWREHSILWDEIGSTQVRKYKPLGEYGGWGLRYSFKHGRAVNVSGDMGLQLVLNNGKKLLIGTQKAEEVKVVLRELGKG